MKNTRRMMFSAVMVLAILAIAGTVWACKTPGYWKNHPDDPAWQLFSLTFGGVTYTVDNAIPVMQTPPAGNKVYNMFSAVVACYLNYLSGTPFGASHDAFHHAVDWLTEHPPNGEPVAASSDDWQEAEPWFLILDAYNNGLLD